MNTQFIPVKSDSLKEYLYDNVRNKLQIRFLTGGLYEYAVSLDVFRQFVEAESKGKFFYKNIKHLPFVKLPDSGGINLPEKLRDGVVDLKIQVAGPKTPRAGRGLDLDNIYKYHAPKPGQQEKYTTIRELAKCLAETIEELCPDSREKSVAFTNLEQAVMWANASIARGE